MNDTSFELHRHIDYWLSEWKKRPGHKPALIKGIRQSGKTHSIKKFAFDKSNYQVCVYLNFWDNKNLIDAFDGDLGIDNIIKELSVKIALPRLVEGKTVFVFDEIQDCPRALLSLKTNSSDKRFDFIASGSYLGVSGYVVGDSTPKPVGNVESFDMRTLDFEEFLMAKGFVDGQIDILKEAFDERKPLSESMHRSFTSLYREYLCVGGFPEAVKEYILTNDISAALRITRRITNDLQDDFGRRCDKYGTPIFSPNEVARIRSAFSLIPSFLGKENKRYVVSKIEGKGAQNSGKDAVSYLVDTGIVSKVHNVDVPSLPLSANMIQNQFKIFPSDIGMFVGMLEDGTVDAILSGNLGMGKGMLYEALIAEAIHKRGGKAFYFAKDTGLELDFVINLKGESTILEVKAANGNVKSAKTVLKHPEHYGKTSLIKIADSNISVSDEYIVIPHYMAHLLFEYSPTLPIK